MNAASRSKLPPVIVWFRLDLRLADNPALDAAVRRGSPVIPLFIHAPADEAPWEPGGASSWWLHGSLQALATDLKAAQSKLILRRGPVLEVFKEMIASTGASCVFWNRRYEPTVIARDSALKEALLGAGVEAKSFNGALLHEPWTIQNQSRKPYQVFTPFWKQCLTQPEPAEPLAQPETLPCPAEWPSSVALDDLKLEPAVDWAGGLKDAWRPGRLSAVENLKRFLDRHVQDYPEQRNRPDLVGTSRLSPHLHFGEISPREVWHAFRAMAKKKKPAIAAWRGSQFLAELGWREFSHHLLFHFPHTPDEPLRQDFKKFRWHHDAALLKAWQKGKTGYPIVDAGMRELWATGWMHNRVRMIAGSFLVKDLLLSWTEGARWFWDTLVDADLAQNTLGWQWTSGCGADAAPYFRIFNPVSQGEKFDPEGAYVRRWCPELSKLPTVWIHKPWEAPPEVLASAGVKLGLDYPEPIVNHRIAREVALEAFRRIKSSN